MQKFCYSQGSHVGEGANSHVGSHVGEGDMVVVVAKVASGGRDKDLKH